MSQFTYLGNNVGVIHGFYYAYRGNPQSGTKDDPMFVQQSKTTIAVIKKRPARYLIAVTADYGQWCNHTVLKDNGFRRVIRFKSMHNHPEEILTLWAKKDEGAKAIPSERPGNSFPANCSVKTNVEASARCYLKTSKPDDAAYKKILGLPVWFKIAEKDVVRTAKATK